MKRHSGFETIRNKKIFYIFSKPQKSSKKLVIMSHGFLGSSVGPARTFVNFESLLLDNGYSVLRFDQPCSGNSDGFYINSSFNEWVSTLSFFVNKFIIKGYQVALLGQSMGATTSMVVAGNERFKTKIACVMLWVPDAKSNIRVNSSQVYEENGQQYKGQFWIEAKNANFFNQ